MTAGSDRPPLAALVLAGEGRTEAVEIAPEIFFVHDISSLCLIASSDGDVLVNTGFPNSVTRNRATLDPHRRAPLRYILLTQSHADHFGGVPSFQEPVTRIVAGRGFVEACADNVRLQPFFGPRSAKLWGSTLEALGPVEPPPLVKPDVLVDDRVTINVGARQIEIIRTPDGETADGLTIWLPVERIAFVGNLFGPVWLSMPFLNTLRGDKPRSVRSYLSSLATVRDLNAKMVVTGHGPPIIGAEQVRADLDRMDTAVRYVRDYTLDGMAAGRTVHDLMARFAWSPGTEISEYHGKASWAVKSIWLEYAGWFHYEDGTTDLFGSPRSRISPEIVKLAGATALAARAQTLLAQGDPLGTLHLAAIMLESDPHDQKALALKRDATRLLLDCSNRLNLSETMWLRSEIAEIEPLLVRSN